MWGISHRRANWPCVPPLHSKVIGIPVCNACTLPAQKLISPTQQSSRFGLCYLQYPTSGYWILWVIELYLAVFRNPTKWPNPYEVYFSPITRSLRQAVWELMQLLKESGSFSPFLPSLKVNTSVAQLHQTQTSWTVACQAFLSMEFSRQEYQSGQTFPSPGDLPDPGLKPRSPALQVNSLPSESPEKSVYRKETAKLWNVHFFFNVKNQFWMPDQFRGRKGMLKPRWKQQKNFFAY